MACKFKAACRQRRKRYDTYPENYDENFFLSLSLILSIHIDVYVCYAEDDVEENLRFNFTLFSRHFFFFFFFSSLLLFSSLMAYRENRYLNFMLFDYSSWTCAIWMLIHWKRFVLEMLNNKLETLLIKNYVLIKLIYKKKMSKRIKFLHKRMPFLLFG